MISGILPCYFAVALAALAADRFDELAPLYQYNASRQLDIQLSEHADRTDYKLYDLSYALPKGGRVSGFLLVPAGAGRHPAIVWMHSGGAMQWMGDAVLLTRAGAVSLIVDPAPGDRSTADGYRDQMIQTVVVLRRAVDLLAARPDVDPAKIGIVGHSFGAMMSAVAASVDPRFRVAVFEVGLLGMSIHIGTSPHPWAEGVRKELGDGLAKYLETISVVDAKHYIGHAPAIPKLFQAAYYDPGVPHKDAEDFFAAATNPKEIRWYDTGHDVNDIGAEADRARFLGKALQLKNVEAVLKAKLASAAPGS